MDKLGTGLLDKLVLKFNDVFWDKEVDWFNYVSDIPYEWTQTLNLYKFTKEPILVMFNCEPSGLIMGKKTDEEILDSAFNVLKKIFPTIDCRNLLEKYYRTNWSQDPYALMSYTYLMKDGKPSDC